jgi:two-component system sensor histidine kinase/response regulator
MLAVACLLECVFVLGVRVSTTADSSGKKVAVLVVEDNETNQRLLVLMLEHLGCSVKAVSNGQEALNVLSEVHYDVVFLDVQMPEMDGFEAARRIRDTSSSVLDHKVPILAITAHVSLDYQQRCYEAGMNDFIAKPIRMNDLTKAVSKWTSPSA